VSVVMTEQLFISVHGLKKVR